MAVRSNVLLPVEREKLKTGNRPLNVHAMKKQSDGVAIIAGWSEKVTLVSKAEFEWASEWNRGQILPKL